MKRVVTFGTFDVFHVGHLNLLQRALTLGDLLFVGVSTDALSLKKKGRLPVFSQDERCRLVSALKCVSGVFLEQSLGEKRSYIEMYEASILVMGDDWSGEFDYLADICDVVYLPRTPSISTTATIEKIRS